MLVAKAVELMLTVVELNHSMHSSFERTVPCSIDDGIARVSFVLMMSLTRDLDCSLSALNNNNLNVEKRLFYLF